MGVVPKFRPKQHDYAAARDLHLPLASALQLEATQGRRLQLAHPFNGGCLPAPSPDIRSHGHILDRHGLDAIDKAPRFRLSMDTVRLSLPHVDLDHLTHPANPSRQSTLVSASLS